ncbi:MAG: GNAT family N-acetyltransferase [Nitrospiraceae bacterium]|nr:MAG: GNAT family N-acetyltransferase [Nitrospiraceae bacterium]
MIKNDIIGIAPLFIEGDTAFLIGDGNVCDYTDFIVSPGEEMHFFKAIFHHLRQTGILHLDCGHMREYFSTISTLMKNADSLHCIMHSEPSEHIYTFELPQTWEGYLSRLTSKERHEIRRKLRRLYEAGDINIRIVETAEHIGSVMDTFFKLFRMNMPEKSEFMTGSMESFFRLLTAAMAEAGLLRILFLDINEEAAAAVLCFDYRSSVYLYNNGYNRQYRNLSPGFLSKLSGIRDSIQRGRKSFNFLKGDETYKRRLGGRPEMLRRVWIELK